MATTTKRSSAVHTQTFPAGTSPGDIRRFVEESLASEAFSKEGIDAAAGSASAVVDGSGDGSRVEVSLEIRGDEINVRVARNASARRSARPATFAEWLTKTIKREGMSQEAAARAIGVSLKTVNRWARGETEPRYRELGLIWDAFGERPPLPLTPTAGAAPGSNGKAGAERRRQDSNL